MNKVDATIVRPLQRENTSYISIFFSHAINITVQNWCNTIVQCILHHESEPNQVTNIFLPLQTKPNPAETEENKYSRSGSMTALV